MRSFRENRKKLKFHLSKLPPPLDVHMPKTNQLFLLLFETYIWNFVSIRSAVWPLWWIHTDGRTDTHTDRPTVKNHFFGIREVQNGYIHKNLDIDFLPKNITSIIVKIEVNQWIQQGLEMPVLPIFLIVFLLIALTMCQCALDDSYWTNKLMYCVSKKHEVPMF